MFSAQSRQLVVLGPAVVLRGAPLGRDPPLFVHSVQGVSTSDPCQPQINDTDHTTIRADTGDEDELVGEETFDVMFNGYEGSLLEDLLAV